MFNVPSPNPVLERITSALSLFIHLLLQCFQKWECTTTKSGLLFSGGGNLYGGFHGDSEVKNPPAHAGDVGSVLSPGGGNGKPL